MDGARISDLAETVGVATSTIAELLGVWDGANCATTEDQFFELPDRLAEALHSSVVQCPWEVLTDQ